MAQEAQKMAKSQKVLFLALEYVKMYVFGHEESVSGLKRQFQLQQMVKICIFTHFHSFGRIKITLLILRLFSVSHSKLSFFPLNIAQNKGFRVSFHIKPLKG